MGVTVVDPTLGLGVVPAGVGCMDGLLAIKT